MKIKVLAVLGLAAVAGLAGCRSAANTNTTVVTNTSTMNTNMTMATPTMSTPMATADPTAKSAVEAAMKKAGLNDVTVEATTGEITIRGTVPKGKMGDVNRIAQETGKRKINNQVSEK